MVLIVNPIDIAEFTPRIGVARLLGWRLSISTNIDILIDSFMDELQTDYLIEDINKKTECDLIILE